MLTWPSLDNFKPSVLARFSVSTISPPATLIGSGRGSKVTARVRSTISAGPSIGLVSEFIMDQGEKNDTILFKSETEKLNQKARKNEASRESVMVLSMSGNPPDSWLGMECPGGKGDGESFFGAAGSPTRQPRALGIQIKPSR